jgi:phospholipase C
MRSRPLATRSAASLLVLGLAAAPWLLGGGSARADARPALGVGASGKITHVVVMYQENHSFNDMLGALCVQEQDRCLGSTTGEISDGTVMPLIPEPDVPPPVGHQAADQQTAINGGKMNGWDKIVGCTPDLQYKCLTQVHEGTVPTLWSLADTYAMSDRTFESGPAASWGSHIELVAGTLNGFLGDQPDHAGEGTGCDTTGDAAWRPSSGGAWQMVPSCIPNKQGQGPYRPSPVRYVPTIMDSMETAGLSWHIYAPGKRAGGYGWAICPTFYECLGSSQRQQVRTPHDFPRDALKGKLANLSIVIPYYADSQHPAFSLMKGDNWIAKSVEAVMQGPDWDSTVIFITYDDCGCFYDPVNPPPGQGIREPMLIISPWARSRFVDHTPASHASMLTFTEHVFGLPPLTGQDASAYDFAGAFDFLQQPLAPVPLPQHRVPAWSLRQIQQHPPDAENDPT